jgi:heme exporter protein A
MRLLVEEISVERGGRRVLQNVAFAAEGGDAIVVVGANGAGKSTLLAALAGLIAPSQGAVRIEDGPEAETPARELIHYVGHREALKNALTLRETLVFWAELLSIPSPGFGGAALSSDDAADWMRLDHALDLPVGYLSAGQRRRASLARLLVAPRPIWLLDEPTTALDVESQKRFAGLMERHRGQGGIVVAATHAPLGLEGIKTLTLGAAAQKTPEAPEAEGAAA